MVIKTDSKDVKVEWHNAFKEMNDAIGLNNIGKPQWLILTFSKECHNHIKHLHESYPGTEWLAICKTQKIWEWHFMVVDMVHPPQKWISWEVETTDDGFVWLTNYLVEKNEPLEDWNLTLHSHHHMGCFWSSVDDRARLWMNDWRTLEWNVVTAYTKEWDTLTVNYKGCVNFYKPYNIEIDCAVDTEDNWSFEKCRRAKKEYEQWKKDINKRGLEIYKEILSNDGVKVDLSSVIDYLWIDIKDILEDNYYIVSRLLPWADKEYYKNVEEMAISQAITEIPFEDLPSEYQLRESWDEELCNQLKQARVSEISTIVSSTSTVWTGYDTVIQSEKWKEYEEKKKEEEDEIWEKREYFNDEDFKDWQLKKYYDIPSSMVLYPDNFWIWRIYDQANETDNYFWDIIDWDNWEIIQ